MNIRRVCLIIIIGVIVLIVVLMIIAPKVIRITSKDVIQELKISAEKHKFKLQNVYLTEENRLQGEINNATIIFSREKNFDEQMLSLQKLIKSSTINSNTKQVDFRFSKIVVK